MGPLRVQSVLPTVGVVGLVVVVVVVVIEVVVVVVVVVVLVVVVVDVTPKAFISLEKLDGVGPVENRPSTDKLHHIVKKKKNIYIHMTCDM